MYHSFDSVVAKSDYAVGSVKITPGKELRLRQPAMRGKSAWFAETARGASLRVELPKLAKTEEWTVALWQILEV